MSEKDVIKSRDLGWLKQEMEFKRSVKKLVKPLVNKEVRSDKMFMDAVIDGGERYIAACEAFSVKPLSNIAIIIAKKMDSTVCKRAVHDAILEALDSLCMAPYNADPASYPALRKIAELAQAAGCFKLEYPGFELEAFNEEEV